MQRIENYEIIVKDNWCVMFWTSSYLQQMWKVLSGLPSDSDLMWTISHIADPSESEMKEMAG